MKNESSYHFSLLTEFEKQLPYYLVGAGAWYDQEPIDRPFGYPHYQWIQFLEGTGTVTLQGKTETVYPGQAMLLLPNDEHSYHALGSSPWIVSWFTFGGSHIEKMLHTVGLVKSGIFTITDPVILSDLIDKALFILQSDIPLKGLEASALVYTFILKLYRYLHQGEQGSYDLQHSRLKDIMTYIENHYNEPITIEELAGILEVSPQHFCLLFKKAFKCRPIEYINTFRINKSKRLLVENSTMKISEIARHTGFESESYYCSTFRKIEGITPKKFRLQEQGV